MNNVAIQLVNDDGDPVELQEQRWHVVHNLTGESSLLCTGEFIDDASSSGNGSRYETKSVSRGGITCEKCLEIVKAIKSIRL